MVVSPYSEGSCQAIRRAAARQGQLHSYVTTEVGIPAGLNLLKGRRRASADDRDQNNIIARPSALVEASVRACRNPAFASMAMYWAKRRFDEAAARHLRNLNSGSLPRAVLGMQGSSDLTFAAAKARGIPTILNAVNSTPTAHNLALERHGGGDVPRHEFISRQHGRWVDEERGQADYLLVPSEYVVSQLHSVEQDKTWQIPYGVSVSTFSSPSTRRREDGGRIRVLAVGQISWRKGVRTTIELARRCQDFADFGLVGPVVSPDLLRALPPNLTHTKTVTHTELAELLAEADVFALLSYEDAYPLAVLEAMASGLPVIVTTDTGTKELIQDGANGYVVPTGSVDAPLRILRGLHESPEQARLIGQRARETVSHQHTWDGYGDRVLDVISKATSL